MSPTDKMVKSTGVVSSATLLSRIFGLVREQVFAYLFGAGLYTDAFVAAFRIPNLLRDLFAEGVMATAFVPVFIDSLTNQGKEEAFHLANLVINALLVILSIVILLGIIFSPALVRLITPGFDKIPGKIELTTLLAQIMFPFLLLVSVAAVCMGMLNSFGHFSTPALAPTMFNLGTILAGFLICPFFDPPIIGMAIGTLLGGMGQLFIQLPALRRRGFHYKPVFNLHHPGVKKILILMTPAIFGVASTQINIFISTNLASLLPEGSVSYLNYSYRLMYLPLGVFGVAVATVNLPLVSSLVAQKKMDEVRATFASSLKLVLFLIIPSTIFLMTASQPIISVLYQHGKFTFFDTVATSKALLFYSLGLFGFATMRVTAPVFYALNEVKTPVMISATAVVVNIILNFILMHPLGYNGLALATSIAGIVNCSLLLWKIDKKIGPLDKKDIGRNTFKILLASLIMGGAVFLIQFLFPLDLQRAALIHKTFLLIMALLIGFFSYAGVCHLLKVEEMKKVLEILKGFKGR